MVYSFAVLEVKLPEQWWSRYWSVSVDKLEEAGSQALANTFYALGKHRRVRQLLLLLAPCAWFHVAVCSVPGMAL